MSSSSSFSVVRFLWVWSLISWHSPPGVSAIRCGTAISKDCLGDDDVRYDDSVGYDLADHAPVFRAVPGFYKSVNTFYTPDGQQAPALPSGGEFFQNPYIEFINVTVDGTRYYQHNYGIVALVELCCLTLTTLPLLRKTALHEGCRMLFLPPFDKMAVGKPRVIFKHKPWFP